MENDQYIVQTNSLIVSVQCTLYMFDYTDHYYFLQANIYF